ncbi:MAG: hypothetical protein LBL24_00520 [Bacteroidales bacterium]|jgi:hypothetical protein|nr:hypothetical protein [Bacteroidales bacterium]
MKKLGFVFLSILILSVGLFSCSKDNDDDNPDASVYLPKRMYGTHKGNQWNATFAYDSQNRLVSSTVENKQTTLTVSYPANGQYEIKVSHSGDDSYTLYTAEETGNIVEIKEIEYYNGRTGDPEEYYYTVENGRIVNWIYTGEMESYTYDSSGNITEMTWTSQRSSLQGTQTMKYDDKKGIFSNIKTPVWILWDILDIDQINHPLFFVNNITELKDNGELDETYEYTYNSDNYPTAIKITGYYGDREEQIDVTVEYY